MKGVVFTEFLEMVEEQHSAAFVEDIVDDAHLPSKGYYTAVGAYPHTEIISLVGCLAEKTGMPSPLLMKGFGEHLFGRFRALYPKTYEGSSSAFNFLAGVETHIHMEVRKLYPEAALPSFQVEQHTPRNFSMIYVSTRPFGDLCEGLILGCLKHFNESATVIREDLQQEPETRIRFRITKTGA
ncbi:MAG: heme NO-binding domain-containing protein [Rhodomicrobiaceae bacterium]